MASSKKKKMVREELTLFDVILSYPDLHDPKPYKGKVYYRVDCLMDADHPQLAQVKKAALAVKRKAFGDDKSEWPEGAQKKILQDGSEREDQAAYVGRFYVSASTQQPVPVVDLKGRSFNPQMVKGGMFGNVALCISQWEFDGDEGVSVYLQGVQVDTTKEKLEGFGGGRSVSQMFPKSKAADESGDEDDDQEDEPRSKKKTKKAPMKSMDDEDDEAPKKKKKKFSDDEEE